MVGGGKNGGNEQSAAIKWRMEIITGFRPDAMGTSDTQASAQRESLAAVAKMRRANNRRRTKP